MSVVTTFDDDPETVVSKISAGSDPHANNDEDLKKQKSKVQKDPPLSKYGSFEEIEIISKLSTNYLTSIVVVAP